MTNPRHLITVCFALLLSATICQTVSAQIWIGDVGSYSDDNNWDEGFVPDADVFEVGEINNGGTAIVDSAVIDPAGLVLGRLNVDVGSLEIRSGGNLTVSSDPGSLQVGITGEGHLTVSSGGELEAQSLSSGGSFLSSIEFQNAAEVTINGNANLVRNTRIVGPDVNFSAQNLTFNSSTIAEINAAEHTPINVAGNATLNGELHVEFNNHMPANGESWTLVDAATVAGNFNQITHSDVLPRGTGLTFSTEDGGNGTLAKLSIETQLVLAVNQRTGQTSIENRTSATTVDIDGYLITSGVETLSPDSWNSFGDQGETGWTESNPSSIHIGELNLGGSLGLGSSTSLQLGELYSFAPTEFGEANPALTFEYHLTNGETKQGQVDFTGLHNNVVLVVDPESGAAAIQNQSEFDVEIDGYLIKSPSGSLSADDWSSLQSGGQGEWTESNPSSLHLGELNLSSSLALGAVSAAVPIGSPFDFDAEQMQRDLTFEFHLAGGETMTGVVEYGSLGFNPLDCNGDGTVNALDLDCACATGNIDGLLNELGLIEGDIDGDGMVAFADFLVLSTNFGTNVDSYTDGDIDCDGAVAFSDFLVLSTNFGQSSSEAASVPEPGGWSLIVFGLLLIRPRARSISNSNVFTS